MREHWFLLAVAGVLIAAFVAFTPRNGRVKGGRYE